MLKLIVTGHLGKDAVLNQTEGGKTVINFNVAHTSKYKDRDGNLVQKTTWVSCSYWTQHTGVAPYLKKGTLVLVEGEPETHWYNAGGEGIVSVQKCRVSRVELMGPKVTDQGQGSAGQDNFPQHQPAPVLPNPSDITEPIDDLPF